MAPCRHNGEVSQTLDEARASVLAEDRRLEQLRQWSRLLDKIFRVPGTDIRFGWDPLLSLIPGLGDLSSPIFTAFLLLHARRMRVPRIVQARMVMNALVDVGLGLIPFLGNVADVFWKASTWNMQLLERHAQPGVRPRRGDQLFVYGVLVALALVAIAPVALIVWVIWRWGIF
jgi:hypothetical protein